MAGTGVAVTTGDLLPLTDNNGSGVYIKGRNTARDFRVDLLGSLFLVGSDGATPRPGVLIRTPDQTDLFVVPAVSPNQTVTVRKGKAVIPRAGQGAYLFCNESDQIINMPAASAVNSRYDVVCCAAFDQGSFGDTAHGPQFWVESGVVSGSPSVPATPTGMFKLAEVLRATNDNVISVGEIGDKRASTSLAQGYRVILPGESTADPGLFIGETRYTTLTGGPFIWNGTTWIPLTQSGRSYGAKLASPYTLGALADIPGLSVVAVTDVPNAIATVTMCAEVNTTGGNYFEGTLTIDGVDQTGDKIHGAQSGLAPEAKSLTNRYVLPAAGNHTIKMRGTHSGGSSSLSAGATSLTVQITNP